MEKEVTIKLTKVPKNPIIIEGFPGFGLVGTITTGFLIDHLKCEQIGRYFFESPPATLAIHDGKVVDPISVYYNKEYNLVIINGIINSGGQEWKIADMIIDLCKQTNAKELITIEGVGTNGETAESKAFYHCTDEKCEKRMREITVPTLGEGIIVGVTSALLLKKEMPTTCIFSETHTKLPDSKAAAKAIEVLDKYLGLKVDYKPLLKQAEEFEKNIKEMMEKSQEANEMRKEKTPSYFG